jgi:DNA-binding CsgD family transcriptional regulator
MFGRNRVNVLEVMTVSLWQRMRGVFNSHRDELQQPRSFNLEAAMLNEVNTIADQEQRSVDEVVSDLLAFALRHRRAAEENLARWSTLTPREQQVASLVAEGCTNQEIADRLVISIDTAKTHVRNSVKKFGLRTKLDLRQALSDWDFSDWQEANLD